MRDLFILLPVAVGVLVTLAAGPLYAVAVVAFLALFLAIGFLFERINNGGKRGRK